MFHYRRSLIQTAIVFLSHFQSQRTVETYNQKCRRISLQCTTPLKESSSVNKDPCRELRGKRPVRYILEEFDSVG